MGGICLYVVIIVRSKMTRMNEWERKMQTWLVFTII